MNNLFIRNLQLSEMYFPIQLAIQEKWNTGIYDAEYFFRTDQTGFFVAFIDREAAGCISAVSYGCDYGFIGLHIVRPEFRNKGIGKALVSAALEKLSGRNIGLNCFPTQREYYESLGFKYSHRIFTYEGVSTREFPMSDNTISPYMLPFESLHEFDREISPGDRKFFIQSWLNQPQSLLLGIAEDKVYKGYGLFRPCQSGYSISPLFCDDYKTAEQLLRAFVYNMEPGKSFSMEIPETNDDALRLAHQMRMIKVNESIRMYSQNEPDIQLQKIYSFNSSVLG